jgi:agmatinase
MSSEFSSINADKALFHIIPAPLEKSVSYGKGTANGPNAIIEASQQLEKWDGFSIPGERGIYTKYLNFGATKDSNNDTEKFLGQIEKEVFGSLSKQHIPIVLGGEHTVSLGAFRAISSDKSPYKGKTGIIQFDAHGDLRDKYENNKLSHACVMRRAFDLGFPIFQIGVRSISIEELDFRKNNKISYIDAYQAVTENINKIKLPDDFPENIYITIDVDGFDISVFPTTGTPEPGGLGWYQVLSIIESIALQRKIIGFDVVELAPGALHASEFAAARLVYNIMGIIERRLQGAIRLI